MNSNKLDHPEVYEHLLTAVRIHFVQAVHILMILVFVIILVFVLSRITMFIEFCVSWLSAVSFDLFTLSEFSITQWSDGITDVFVSEYNINTDNFFSLIANSLARVEEKLDAGNGLLWKVTVVFNDYFVLLKYLWHHHLHLNVFLKFSILR